jgi:putative transposase
MHVRQRGNNRQDCFFQDNDRLVYLAILRDLLTLRRCALHAYCLMTNHIHLLLTPADEGGCSLMMRDLGRRYASYFNGRYSRTGQLWEGRFRSCLVDSGTYVLGCYRYIELNPVRAGMAPSAGAYPWSSHSGNVGARLDELLTAHAEYDALGLQHGSRTLAYRGLIDAPEDAKLVSAMRESTETGFPLVGEKLKSTLEAQGMRIERERPGPCAEPASPGASSEQLDLLTQ